MSILRTYNLQSIDSSNSNIQLTENAGAIVSGLTTAQSGLHVTSGNVGVGDDNPDVPLNVKAGGASFAGQTTHVKIEDTTSLAANVGGLLALEGVYTSGGDPAAFAMIHGGKENATDGNYAGYLRFLTRPSNALPQERLRITPEGYVGINENDPIHQLSVKINSSTAWDSTKNISNTTNNDFIGLNIDNIDSGANPEVGIMLQAGASGSGQYTINCLRTNVNTGDLIIRTRDGGVASKEQLRITSAGHVGIGTTAVDSHLTLAAPSATARLELRRTNEAGGGSYGAINFTALDGHSVASIHAKGDGDGDDNGGDIVFRTTSDATTNDPYIADERLRIKSDGIIETVDSTYGASNFRLAGAYAEVRDQKSHDVPGGTFTSGAWRTRALNNIHHDNDNIILNLASNRFRLGPGRYRIEFSTPAYGTNRHQCRLYNVTAGSVVEYGEANYSSAAVRNSADTGSTHASQNFVRGSARVTLTAAETDFEVQHRCQTTNATNGYGVEADFTSNVEVYSRAIIYKEV